MRFHCRTIVEDLWPIALMLLTYFVFLNWLANDWPKIQEVYERDRAAVHNH